MTSEDAVKARERARRLYPRSTAIQGGYLKGARAADAGLPRSVCPYKKSGKRSWRDVFRKAWLRGYDSLAPESE